MKCYIRLLPLISFLILIKYSIGQEPYIAIPEGYPGIRGLFAFYPPTAGPMRDLAEELLVKESSLSRGERELIAAYVSFRNACVFCCTCHSAIASYLLNDEGGIVAAVLNDPSTAPISDKLKALLVIAGKVQVNGKMVCQEDITNAHACGTTDLEIHHTVLIAAAFCMFNRYVDGLAARTPTDPTTYDAIAAIIAQQGYIRK
jgi:uncharacterized peroxidase-related enzyme